MTLSPEVVARVQAVETKLEELDPILHDFCLRRGYTFSSHVGVWPRRKVWAREGVDRALDLIMDLTVPEIIERGFYPEMPWSLLATASLMLPRPGRILSEYVFHSLPFTVMADVLAARLDDGFAKLREITREDIIARGQIHGRGV